jgi:hypothetical protein
MTALLCYRLELPVGSTYAAGAAVLMGTLADQRITRRTVAGYFAGTVAASERFRNMLGNTFAVALMAR